MAKLPITCAVQQTTNPDGSTSATATWTDGDGVEFRSLAYTWPAAASAIEIIGDIRRSSLDAAKQHLTPADLPARFSVQIGLDTGLRNLDLL